MRVFFALSIAETLEQQLQELASQCEQQLNQPGIRWIPAENYHITLSFLGDVHAHQLFELDEILAESIAGVNIKTLYMQELAWFPSPHHPRLLVVLVQAQASLLRFQKRLQQRLRQAGFVRPAKRFVPHITLARLPKDGAIDIAKPLQFNPSDNIPIKQWQTTMDEVVLFESTLHIQGSRYEPLFVKLLSEKDHLFL